jgi:RNA polymerase sigma factor (sigma-70 family)
VIRDDRLAGARFLTTRPSAVVGLRSADDAERTRSWDAIVSAYWKPAYKHVRLKWRCTPDDAADLVQSFFERAIERGFFDGYDAELARFRTFVRVCLDRFVSNERKAAGRLKRGGGAERVALDFDGAERELARVDPQASVEELFDREWRRAIFEWGVDALRERCERDSKASAYEIFSRYDLAETEARPTYGEIADALGLPVTTVTNQLAWARRELAQLVHERLGELTATDDELTAEARALTGGS